jgi:hypothetical protein
LEELATAVLTNDDFPTIRKIGGRGDFGLDAVEEVFYEAQREVKTVIQVTSAQAQVTKLRDTLKKLAEHKIEPSMLVFLTRHPVAASVRRDMIVVAAEFRVGLDVRDSQYLVDQLSKAGSPIFARFFGSASAQLNELLGKPDPLATSNSRLQHALLATLGAYVLSKRSRIARTTLFDKTVLAALASLGGMASETQIEGAVRELSPGEGVDGGRLAASLGRLEAGGQCKVTGDTINCSEEALSQFAANARNARSAFDALLAYILERCKAGAKIEDAQVGYIERNLRRAILVLLRATGPISTNPADSVTFPGDASEEVRITMSKDLPPNVARAALAAFSTFVSDRQQARVLSPLVKSYAALAIRNLDPAGRRWQQAALARSAIAIDTDVLLYLIVDDLPEHRAVAGALEALRKEGVELVVADHVFAEAVGHISRASRTYARFANRLLRYPPQLVDAHVWHAVVRGYYYAHKNGFSGGFETYCKKFHIGEESTAFVEHLLARRVTLKRAKLDDVPEAEKLTLYQIEEAVMSYRERSRRKAVFRDPVEMAQRVRADVAMAMSLASRSSQVVGAPARGYVASSDHAFRLIEEDEQWKPRPRVHVWTRALPELAEFACASGLQEDDSVSFLFHPVNIAAAEEMSAEIGVLASIGIDLKEVPLDRLDWDLKRGLKAHLDDLEDAVVNASEDKDRRVTLTTLAVVEKARDAGYTVPPQLALLVDDYGDAVQAAGTERAKREEAEERLRQFVTALQGTATTKGRRKLNALIRELGINMAEAEEVVDVEENDGPD